MVKIIIVIYSQQTIFNKFSNNIYKHEKMFKLESLKVCCPFIYAHYNTNNGNNDKSLKYNTLE